MFPQTRNSILNDSRSELEELVSGKKLTFAVQFL